MGDAPAEPLLRRPPVTPDAQGEVGDAHAHGLEQRQVRCPRLAKAALRSGSGANTRTPSIGGTAASAAACGSACSPVPMIANARASGRASRRVATPEAAAVRSWPRAKASITARSAPEALSKRMRSGVDPFGV